MISAAFFLALLMGTVSPRQDEPEFLWHNGDIHTFSRGRVEAMAIRGDRIVALGRTEDLARAAGPGTTRIDLQGRTVTPGLIDSHGHMSSLGRILAGRLDLRATKSFQDLLDSVSTRVAETKRGEWILGSRWDEANWGRKEFPTHAELSAVSPDHPVLLHRVDGHAALANHRAMELAGIGPGTKDPGGGRILRDSDGNPTGIFVDHAMSLFHPVLPARGGIRGDLLAAQERCLSLGLTGVHDAGIDPPLVEAYRKLEAEGTLRLRVYGMLKMNRERESWLEEKKPIKGERFTLRAIKVFLDGAMGSRGAWLLEDYADRRGNRGLPQVEPDLLESWTRLAISRGWQVCIHAIGDRAIRETLDAYQRAEGKPEHRLRVEHAQVAAWKDLERFARQGVIPSMQPTHATSDMRWAKDRLGEDRLRGAYAWATLVRGGAFLAAGSDFPVESPDPMKGIYAAVTRQDGKGWPEGGWRPEERLTRREAFRAFTLGAAHAAFEEEEKGTLEPGKLADFVVWSADPVTCPPEELLRIRALRTVIGGETVFKSP